MKLWKLWIARGLLQVLPVPSGVPVLPATSGVPVLPVPSGVPAVSPWVHG